MQALEERAFVSVAVLPRLQAIDGFAAGPDFADAVHLACGARAAAFAFSDRRLHNATAAFTQNYLLGAVCRSTVTTRAMPLSAATSCRIRSVRFYRRGHT